MKLKSLPLTTMLTIVGISLATIAGAQCVSISCPSNVNVSNDPGACGAVVNYTPPVGTTTCNSNVTFNYTGAIVNWTVPAGVTSIDIEARGAQGGQSTTSTTTSGLGASMSGTFAVTPGQQLKILVGQQYSATAGNGGGGGTFVTDMSNTPLIVAGGGGGSSQGADSPDKHGKITTTGGTGAGAGGTGGINGNGGNAGTSSFNSGAGGGLLTNGANGQAQGGSAFVNGGAGGNVYALGGFGGGGSGSSYVVGGGGGGYSGGGGGGNSSAGVGGGGGSFNAGTNQTNTPGINTGHGSVIITVPQSLTTTQTAGLAPGALFPIGTTTNTYSVTDGTNTTSCSFTVTVADTEFPTLTGPTDITVNNDPGVCGAVVTFATPGGVDNCPGTTTLQNSGLASGATFPIGVTTNIYTATDAAGNATPYSFTVTVVDNELPAINCPADITANTDAGVCGAVVTYNAPIGTDNCPSASTSYVSGGLSGDFYPTGVSTITYEVVDNVSQTNSCSFTITVTDDEDPTIACPGDVNTCVPLVDNIAPGISADNCGVTGISYATTGATTLSGNDDASGLTFNVGTTNVVYTATDAQGNVGTCAFDVEIVAPTDVLAGASGTTENNMVNVTGNTDGLTTTCDLIATVDPSGTDPVSGDVDFSVTIDATVNNYSGQSYLQRHYDIEPFANAATATATVTLYALQSEFDDFNAAQAPGNLLMPTGGVDNGNIKITQYHGTGTAPGNYTGTAEVITPSVTWDATNSWWELTFDVTGFSGFYIHTSYTNNPLAIHMTKIEANNAGPRNKINWATAKEDRGDRFGLEHSADGINFKEIYNTTANGSASQYTYWHETPNTGKNYYRLKLYTGSEKFTYSEVVTATTNAVSNFAIETYPNPVQNTLTVKVTGVVASNSHVVLTDIAGKIIATQVITNNTAVFDMSNQANGIYFIKYTDKSHSEVLKVTKQ